MRVACVGYREWALEIYDELARVTDNQFLILRSRKQFDEKAIVDFRPDLVLFYGWSWMVPVHLIEGFRCLMLHPSPLPKYRGGSPIQNQIIRGEVEGAVSIFLMEEGLDSGPILAQESLSLQGNLAELFGRITFIGTRLTLDILSDWPEPRAQDHSKATLFRRRKPEDSELTLEELSKQSAEYLYNKIRMLQDPYPNAFLSTADGRELVFTDARVREPGAQ